MKLKFILETRPKLHLLKFTLYKEIKDEPFFFF